MSDDVIRAEEHWAHKGAVELFVFRKYWAGRPAADRQVLFLVHGSSLCARTGFDLSVPGKRGYSMMDWFAQRGFDVWTMDYENYGRSSRTSSNSDIASGADDLTVAMQVVQRETGAGRIHLFGSSSGALRAGLFANRSPDLVASLSLDAFV